MINCAASPERPETSYPVAEPMLAAAFGLASLSSAFSLVRISAMRFAIILSCATNASAIIFALALPFDASDTRAFSKAFACTASVVTAVKLDANIAAISSLERLGASCDFFSALPL